MEAVKGGINQLTGRIIILPDAKMDYSPAQIRRFVKWWNDGIPTKEIGEKFTISHLEVLMLVAHCEIEGWIQDRPGGYKGTKKRIKRVRK
jgi:hypothetical protein